MKGGTRQPTDSLRPYRACGGNQQLCHVRSTCGPLPCPTPHSDSRFQRLVILLRSARNYQGSVFTTSSVAVAIACCTSDLILGGSSAYDRPETPTLTSTRWDSFNHIRWLRPCRVVGVSRSKYDYSSLVQDERSRDRELPGLVAVETTQVDRQHLPVETLECLG
jgi:hypothetical protein